MKDTSITGEQIKAARALAGWSAQQLATASGVGVTTIRIAEAGRGTVRMMAANLAAIVRALDEAGVILISDNGGGAGARLKEPRK